ncbi:putative pentatricopeptide repeat-containing protein At3g15200, partial [Bidens hawaiensis]|uniref:putative pentatricopeptide repeat-containing protein At3g15200 n=1 Tax=Bidens hawaiensis TaxID=980011 RepID=UPI00404A6794
MQPRIRSILYYRKLNTLKPINNHPPILITHNPNLRSQAFHNQTQNPSNFNQDHTFTNSKALEIQTLLKQINTHKPVTEIEQALTRLNPGLTEELILNVLRRHRSDWKPAYVFFNWVSNTSGYSPETGSYNEIIDILGKMKRFKEAHQVLDEMSKRSKTLVTEKTYGIMVNRYAAAHKLEEATEFFYKRIEFGLELDLIAFQTLLISLCRYKNVEAAEFLFHSKMHEFEFEHNIKTLNIILNGWCVLGSLREAKRFWNDIITSKYKPDVFTYGIFINSLTKAGKISTAVKLFQAMWDKGCTPDVTICNCIIDGLCFKKRIPEALEIFKEMNEKDCSPNVVTYNSLIKHLCKIRRMEKVDELLNEMVQKGGDCAPNARTYGYLLNAAKKADEVEKILESMKTNGCGMTGDTYNL